MNIYRNHESVKFNTHDVEFNTLFFAMHLPVFAEIFYMQAKYSSRFKNYYENHIYLDKKAL